MKKLVMEATVRTAEEIGMDQIVRGAELITTNGPTGIVFHATVMTLVRPLFTPKKINKYVLKCKFYP